MSDSEGPVYKDGDIVWVKLGSCWWPGEVTEDDPEDYPAKKPPLAVVKFFNESSYEFVKNENNIYPYNCDRKNEFIRKGMDSFRANNTHMAKFPGDVSLAEIRTDGNPNILSEPLFAPQKRSSIIAEVFGSPTPKKPQKENRQSRGRSSSTKNSAKKPKINITHRRFLGYDDYEAHIRVQYPGKDTEHLGSERLEILRLNADPTENFNCSSCLFNTNRLEVMLFHVQCHIKGITSPVPVKKKSPKKKKPRVVPKHVTSDEDRTNSSTGFLDTDSEEEKPKPKRKKKSSPKKPKQNKVEEEKTTTDIRTNLLAEWSDSEDNEEAETSKHDTSEESKREEDVEEEKKVEDSASKDLKSCFDFDEEEEDSGIVHTAVGRKIPRVIPPTDKRKSTEDDNEASLPVAEDDENRMEILKVSESLNENSNSVSNDAEVAKEEEVFKDLMDSTSVPDLPEVPDAIKPEKNFPDSKNAKIPDKKEEVATKLTNPKKRFVKSFEDFELLQNEQRRAQEEKEEEMRREKAVVEPLAVATSSVEKEREREPVLEDTSSASEEPPPVEEEPIGTPGVDSADTPTEDKSGEKDAESKIEEKEVESKSEEKEAESKSEEKGAESKSEEKEEEAKSEDKEPEEIVDSEDKIPEPETKTPDPDPQEPEVETPEADVSKKIDSGVQISKLKCQIMSKLSDEEPEPSKISKGKSSHRTPRSKILESYRNDKSKDEETVEENKKDQHASKKSKYLRLLQEEKKEEEEIEVEMPKEDVIKEVEALPEKNPDEEVGKINQIDEYLNDFLFDFPKKSETPKEEVVEEEPKIENEDKVEVPTNEVLIKCAGSEDEPEGELDFAIKTNLTNFNRPEEEMSALNTLAMVSQLETSAEPEKPKEEEEEEKKVESPKIPLKPEPELVPIDGNLTVVSEKDLADGQVEITANASPTYKKPVTLTNFSMDFSECNSNSNSDSVTSEVEEKKQVKKDPGPEDMFDLEEHIPSQIVDKTQPVKEPAPTSKLLERLTEPKTKDSTVKAAKVPVTKDSTKTAKTKFVIKPATSKIAKAVPSNKPIILSEKIIKPVKTVETSAVSVQKITSKRNLQDPDEIDTFIIQKGKNIEDEDDSELSEDLAETPAKKFKKSTAGMDPKKLQVSSSATSVKKRGKAKILQQTIITPAGEIIQPNVATTVASITQDDNVFDINSMPIVLSDQILTPESIENMPIYLSDSVQAPEVATPVTKPPTTIVKRTPIGQQMRVLNKSISSPVPKLVKTPKILGTMGSKIIKQNSFSSTGSKHGKYVIVTQAPTTPTSKYTVGKKQAIIKRVGGDLTGTLTKVQNIAPEPSGNKIMILTDQQGQQQRVLLTPAQQKMMGYQSPKVTKTVVKGNILQKSKDGSMTAIPGSSGLISKNIASSRLNSNQTLISSSGHVLTPIHTQSKTVRVDKSMSQGRKIQMQSQKVAIKPPQQKTILIKNQHGQTVRKIQGTDDALLDKQVAEQIEAIKASGALQQKQEVYNYKSTPKTAFRRSYAKKVESPKPIVQKVKEVVPPPLAPISPKKVEVEKPTESKQERALHQLVIQDAMGNQTTITEGQILALPSETVDGQPQSYMLVTLDESGNLTPLNNEALLSLDPNLGLGGDLGNTVLQIDQSAIKEEVAQPEPEVPKVEPVEEVPLLKEEEKPEVTEVVGQEQIVDPSVMQPMAETGQQLIVTGDPIAAQKFLESLTEGNTDLANILASAEGSSILIHADGQQILINTDADNQMLLSVNSDSLSMTESSEGGGNPIFANQPTKNQDILAAALADTDVFQQEQNGSQGKVSQLSPNSALYPINVSNVLETSLTLNSPIMTPLEVPSTNTKKIDEGDILSQVPKNVDLPITITDPNISQTVAQQQVASLMVNELQSNLELTLPISDAAITVASTEMSSPGFGYSLPSLDGGDIGQKPFNSSMPLLTEDTEEVSNEATAIKEEKAEPELIKQEEEAGDKGVTLEEDKAETKISPDGSFLDESEGLCTLGGEMCSSLSEPPPDMFDLSAVLSSQKEEPKGDLVIEEAESSESANPDTSLTETSSPNTANEDSCEIPVQPEIVTTLKEEGFEGKRGGDELENDSKKCKFD